MTEEDRLHAQVQLLQVMIDAHRSTDMDTKERAINLYEATLAPGQKKPDESR